MKPKRLARTVVYENPWVNLYVDKVQFPGGRIIEEHHLLDFEKGVNALVSPGGTSPRIARIDTNVGEKLVKIRVIRGKNASNVPLGNESNCTLLKKRRRLSWLRMFKAGFCSCTFGCSLSAIATPRIPSSGKYLRAFWRLVNRFWRPRNEKYGRSRGTRRPITS